MIPKVLLAKVNPLEQQLMQMRENKGDATVIKSVIPTETVASGALKSHNDALRKDSVMKGIGSTSRI